MAVRSFLFIIFFVLSAASTWAQDSSSRGVVVHKDPRIDLLIRKQATVNHNAKKSVARTAKGFRLLVVNTTDRNEATSAKTKVYQLFPELKAYLAYQAPYFKLKVGNFTSRADAERYRKIMGGQFPKGVFIMNDIVEVKPEKEEEKD